MTRLFVVLSPPYQMHNEEIVNHLYNAGFQTGVCTWYRCCYQMLPLMYSLRIELCRHYTGEQYSCLWAIPSHALATEKHVHQNSYRLHAIILSRSPFLAHLMSTSPQSGGQRCIYVHLEHEPEVTQEVSFFCWFKARAIIGAEDLKSYLT
jgi:hypothetical protein